MSDFINHLAAGVTSGRMSRREFMGRAMAAGLTLTAAGQFYASAAAAQTPRRGGHLKLGLQGSSATDVLDPAKALVQFHLVVVRNWGDTLVESHPPDRCAGPRPCGVLGAFRGCLDLDLQDSQGCPVP
jgi:peptide/nickel transport system substrate-binding protein